VVAHQGEGVDHVGDGLASLARRLPVGRRGLGVTTDYRSVDFSHVGDFHYWHREMLRPGADLCLILHRSTLDERSADLAHQTIAADVPTYLISDDRGVLRRLNWDGDHSGTGGSGATVPDEDGH
jgi:hypothetical protein